MPGRQKGWFAARPWLSWGANAPQGLYVPPGRTGKGGEKG